jgi:hypothetical protein
MSLKDQVLAAFKKDQSNMKLTIKDEEGIKFYKIKVWNETTEGCFENFLNFHSKRLNLNFNQIIIFKIDHATFKFA